MASSGIATTLKITVSSAAFTNEATTKVTANTVYRITDSTKRIWDPSVALTVDVDADGAGAGAYATAAVGDYTVNFLDGTVTFTADQGASALVRCTGSAYSVQSLVEGRGFSFTAERVLYDSTVFHATNVHRLFTSGPKRASGSMNTLDVGHEDLDPTGTTTTLVSLAEAGTLVVVEVNPGGAGRIFRSFARIKSLGNAATPDALQELTVNWEGDCVMSTNHTGEGASWIFTT